MLGFPETDTKTKLQLILWLFPTSGLRVAKDMLTPIHTVTIRIFRKFKHKSSARSIISSGITSTCDDRTWCTSTPTRVLILSQCRDPMCCVWIVDRLTRRPDIIPKGSWHGAITRPCCRNEASLPEHCRCLPPCRCQRRYHQATLVHRLLSVSWATPVSMARLC